MVEQLNFLNLYEPPVAPIAPPSCPPRQGHKVPQHSHAGSQWMALPIDSCQTPAYALAPLMKYTPQPGIVWEPAADQGYLVRALQAAGAATVYSDIKTGQNFHQYQPITWDRIITNPPYSGKNKALWLARCFELGKPFALLLPVGTLGLTSIFKLIKQATIEIEVIFLDRRVNFKMPNKGWAGSAQFPVCWITWQWGIGKPMSFEEMPRWNSPEWEGDICQK